MPNSQVTSKFWFVRITMPHKAMGLILQEIKENLMMADHVRWLIVGHVGERSEKEHAHCLVELHEPRQKQSIDKRYKHVFGVSGSDYSSKPWDGKMGLGAASYLFHDPNFVIFWDKGFTQEELADAQKHNAEVQKVVEVNKQRASGRCVDRILNAIKESDRHWTRGEIARRLIDDVHDGVMYEPGDYVMKRYVEEIYMKQLSGEDWETYARMRVDMIVRSFADELSAPI